jgi:sialidase-1
MHRLFTPILLSFHIHTVFGQTWPKKYWIELDEGSGAGYSCITSINENTIGIIYEGSQAHMTFQTIDVTNIIEE